MKTSFYIFKTFTSIPFSSSIYLANENIVAFSPNKTSLFINSTGTIIDKINHNVFLEFYRSPD